MKTHHLVAGVILSATSSLAEETKQLDAHEHGVGQLNIAFSANKIAMELHAPGSDIVGFEYGAKTDADHAAIDTAIETLSDPSKLFVFPKVASCTVIEAKAKLESEDADHGHDDHDDDEDHDDHDEEPGHTEFHAEYLLECGNLSAISAITFSYFEIFPNALELEIQVVSDKGATAFEVEREVAKLDLRGVF
ncbi:MAG: DUF2796 domain-containing protein [Planktomarina sp.]|nr:DUF2796 domain-containing protein [Planktomarina sp.]